MTTAMRVSGTAWAAAQLRFSIGNLSEGEESAINSTGNCMCNGRFHPATLSMQP